MAIDPNWLKFVNCAVEYENLGGRSQISPESDLSHFFKDIPSAVSWKSNRRFYALIACKECLQGPDRCVAHDFALTLFYMNAVEQDLGKMDEQIYDLDLWVSAWSAAFIRVEDAILKGQAPDADEKMEIQRVRDEIGTWPHDSGALLTALNVDSGNLSGRETLVWYNSKKSDKSEKFTGDTATKSGSGEGETEAVRQDSSEMDCSPGLAEATKSNARSHRASTAQWCAAR